MTSVSQGNCFLIELLLDVQSNDSAVDHFCEDTGLSDYDRASLLESIVALGGDREYWAGVIASE